MSTFNLKWRNFQSNTVQKLARGFHTGGEPFVTELVFQNLPTDKLPNKYEVAKISINS